MNRLELKKQSVEGQLDQISLAAAVLLFLSPWLLGYANLLLAAETAWITATFIGIISLIALFHFAKWEEWMNIAASVWLVFAPWILDFSRITTAVAAFIGVGGIIASISAAELWGNAAPDQNAE